MLFPIPAFHPSHVVVATDATAAVVAAGDSWSSNWRAKAWMALLLTWWMMGTWPKLLSFWLYQKDRNHQMWFGIWHRNSHCWLNDALNSEWMINCGEQLWITFGLCICNAAENKCSASSRHRCCLSLCVLMTASGLNAVNRGLIKIGV